MALLYHDSFESITSSSDIASRYDDSSGTTLLPTGGRFGLHGLSIGTTGFIVKDIAGSSTMVAGGVWKPAAAKRSLMRFREGSVIHVDIELQQTLGIVIRRNATEIARMDTSLFTTAIHHFIEVKVVIANSGGSVEIRIDGQTTVFTDLDTREGVAGVGDVDNIVFGSVLGGTIWSQVHIDDANFIGDHRIDLLMPDGDGNYSEFTTATPSATHAENVDEIGPDDDTSYNETVTTNHKDTFTMANLAAITSQTIHGVQQFSFAKGTGASPGDLRNKLRISGNDHDGGNLALINGTYKYLLEMWLLDPEAAAAWTETVVNALESGYEDL